MVSNAQPTLSRRHFHQTSDSREKTSQLGNVLLLLLAQDGSTTRLCEATAGGPVSLHVLDQRVVHSVPREVSAALPGSTFIERTTSLAIDGQVMMDNLAFIALEGLPDDVRLDLEDGKAPIGHLLARMWVRRGAIDAPALLWQLWDRVGLPDPEASRAYCITTPEGPRMVIAETFRRGMLLRPGD
jgi:chorismate-pyruvate lyase